jgi:hypothetical protein
MTRQCPHCHSANVRRSRSLESEASLHPFHSPYRCRDCDRCFWFVSKKIHVGATLAGALIVSASLVFAGEALLAYRDSKLAPHPTTPQLVGHVSASEPVTRLPSLEKLPSPEEENATQDELRRLNDILFKQPSANP